MATDRREPDYHISPVDRKRAVADAVFDSVLRATPVIQNMGDVIEVAIMADNSSSLKLTVQVKTQASGTYYYTIQVKEQT